MCIYENVCDLDSLIPNVLVACRAIKHSSTGFSPVYLHNGREFRLSQVIFPAPDKEPPMITAHSRNSRKSLEGAFYAVSQNLKRTHKITKDRSQHYPRYRSYETGYLVYVLTPKDSRGKLGEVWCDPWKTFGRTGVCIQYNGCGWVKTKTNSKIRLQPIEILLPPSTRPMDTAVSKQTRY